MSQKNKVTTYHAQTHLKRKLFVTLTSHCDANRNFGERGSDHILQVDLLLFVEVDLSPAASRVSERNVLLGLEPVQWLPDGDNGKTSNKVSHMCLHVTNWQQNVPQDSNCVTANQWIKLLFDQTHLDIFNFERIVEVVGVQLAPFSMLHKFRCLL